MKKLDPVSFQSEIVFLKDVTKKKSPMTEDFYSLHNLQL